MSVNFLKLLGLIAIFGLPGYQARAFDDIKSVKAADISDKNILPLVRVAPKYPRKAAMAGTNGEVKLRFDIGQDGSVIKKSIEVISEKPGKVFRKSSIDALQKFKYKPHIFDGEPVIVQGVTYTFTYTLGG